MLGRGRTIHSKGKRAGIPAAILAGAAIVLSVAAVGLAGQTLVGFASLPADTFAAGPTSGQFIAAANGRMPPFVDRQPVQGFSSAIAAADGAFLAISDNGFGAKQNSPDYLLRVYTLVPQFSTADGGSGTIELRSFITLRDPDRRVPFPIVADVSTYPGSDIPVDAAIRRGRLLTGADFDIESFRQAPDGSLWFGDEFGPFLLHADRDGRVLEAPYPLPGVRSPQSPLLAGDVPNLGASKGLEGLALSADGRRLYPMLEGPLTTDADRRRLVIAEFDLETTRFTDRRWAYRLEDPSHAIGDLTGAGQEIFLAVERDNAEGDAAKFKKIFAVSLDRVDAAGFLVKREVADLLALDNPARLGGGGGIFRFPFQTIESVLVLGPDRLGVLADNNYPFSSARTPGQPDPNEFILLALPVSLTAPVRVP